VKEPDQFRHFRRRELAVDLAPGSHAFGKIQPKLRVLDRPRAGSLVQAFLLTEVCEHRSAQLAFIQANAELCQIGGEGLYVVVIVARILAEILAREFARAPRLIKRMAEQVMLPNPRFQLLKEFLCGQSGVSSREHSL
jgi:hypothetical protein